MTKLIIRWTTSEYLERKDEETGETYKYPKVTPHIETYDISEILCVEHKWAEITISFLDGDFAVIKGDNITEFYR